MKLSQWYYQSSARYWFRYYFVRKKAPLSYILWCNILRYRICYQSGYAVSLAWVDGPDATISFHQGVPGENYIELLINGLKYPDNIVRIPLSHRSMKRVMQGFSDASRVSREQIKKEANQ